MRIVRLQAEGFKRLVAVDISPDGDLIEVRGNNDEGKSSLLDAIFATLAGKDAAPIKPVRTGEEYALIRLDLGDMKVTRYFGDDGATKLKVENADGAVYQQGQTMLDALVGSISFDPMEFANMAAKDQAAEIRRLVNLDVDLDALAADDRTDYADRRDVNRDAQAVKARVEAIAVPPDLPDDLPDRAAIADELASAAEVNGEIERERAKRIGEEQSIGRAEGEAAALQRQANEYRERADRATKEAEEMDRAAETRKAALAALSPLATPIDTVALREAMAAADQLAVHGARRDEKACLSAEFATLKARSEGLTKRMADRATARAKALEAAKMPVDGMSFADVGGDLVLTLNGEPFEQASSANKLKTSVAIAMASNPKLRVLRIKDGSLLDKRNLEILRKTATDHDFQIWTEFVGDEGAGIIMEAGKVKGAPDPDGMPAPKRRKAKDDDAPAVDPDATVDTDRGPVAAKDVEVGDNVKAVAAKPKARAMREFTTPAAEGSLL